MGRSGLDALSSPGRLCSTVLDCGVVIDASPSSQIPFLLSSSLSWVKLAARLLRGPHFTGNSCFPRRPQESSRSTTCSLGTFTAWVPVDSQRNDKPGNTLSCLSVGEGEKEAGGKELP